jgi:transcriptional regulator with XRE-family HTH domain
MILKKQLEHLIKIRGLTASELSRKSGVSKQVVSLWLGGAKPKNIDQVKSIADTLGVTLDYLLFGTEEKTANGLDTFMGDEWFGGVFEVKFRRIKEKK